MSHLLLLLLLLVIIIFSAKLAGGLSTRFGQPAVFGEILVGLILGPTVLNLFNQPMFHSASSILTNLDLNQIRIHDLSLLLGSKGLALVISDMAEIGVILLMFVAGMETDIKGMKKVGNTAFWSAVGGVVLPMAGATVLSRYFNYSWSECIFIGAILTATSVSISAQTLMELKQLKSKEGSTILGAAVIDDVMGIIVLSLVVAFAFQTGSSGMTDVFLTCLYMSVFFVLSIWLGKKYLERITEMVIKIPVSQVLLAFVLIVAFFYAWAAEYLGKVAAITGSYIAGVLFAQTKFKKEIDAGIHPITYSLFVPIFFINIGLQANARELGNNLVFLIMIVVVAILAKIIGCGVGARFSGFNNQESLRVGIGMISRGEVGLIVAGYGLSKGIIDQNVFSVMVIMVLATTMMTPLLLRFVFPKTEEVSSPDVFESIAHVEDKTDEENISSQK